MAKPINETKLAQSFLINTKQGQLTWSRIEKGSVLRREFTGLEDAEEGFVSTITVAGRSVKSGVFRVSYSRYDPDSESHYSVTGYEIVLYSSEGIAIRRLGVPTVIASELFEEARSSTFSGDLDVFQAYLSKNKGSD